MHASWTRCCMERAQGDYRTFSKGVTKSFQKDKEEYISQLCVLEKAEKATTEGHLKILYQTTEMVTGKYGQAKVTVKDKDGKAIFGKEAQGTDG